EQDDIPQPLVAYLSWLHRHFGARVDLTTLAATEVRYEELKLETVVLDDALAAAVSHNLSVHSGYKGEVLEMVRYTASQKEIESMCAEYKITFDPGDLRRMNTIFIGLGEMPKKDATRKFD